MPISFKNKRLKKISENNKIDLIEEEEKNKEFFLNSPKIYFFIKTFLLFEGDILRILIQLGDLYFCGIITNIYLEIIIIQISASAEYNALIKIFAFISAIIFCFLMKIILTIAYWELYQLKWFHLNPFDTLSELLNIKLENYLIRNIYYIFNIIFGILFWLFITGLATMASNNGKFLDCINLIIFIIIPFLKFLLIYLTYIYISIINCFPNKSNNTEIEENPFFYWMKLNNLIDQGIHEIGNKEYKNAIEEINSDNDNTNCFEQIIFKDILFQIKIIKIIKIRLKTLLKIFFSLLSFIYIIILFFKKDKSIEIIFFFFFTYLISLIISIHFSTPSWTINSIYRWYLKIKKKYDKKHQINCRKFNEKFGAFKVLDLLPLITSLIIIFFFIFFVLHFKLNGNNFMSVKSEINRKRKFNETNWQREYFSENKNIENPICFTNVHGLSLLKISSLAFASYMKDIRNVTKIYKKSFFKESKDEITEMKYLNIKSSYSAVLMININIQNEKPLTVFSIQASIKQLDYWLDFEIFCNSALFTLIRLITINNLESLTSNAIIWLLTIPIRILEKCTLFYQYIESITKDINKELDKINEERNIIFTGHSLGGAIAKYLGLKYHKENVAISGPGITPLEYNFKKDKNYYKYFKSNLIDIIPDNDIIPRIDKSGGIRYRVLCEKGFISCHLIERIICQIGAICRREDLTGDLCMSIFGRKDYDDIRKIAGIKIDIPEYYNN